MKNAEQRNTDPLAVEVEGLRYELDRPATRNGRKVVVSVRLAAGGDSAPLVDRADLYSFRQRHGLSVLVSETFARKPDEVMGALALLLDQVERLAATAKKAEPVVLTQARRTAGEKLLRSPDLLERAAHALDARGYVGEERNKRLVYLVATSRLLEKPLSAILFAQSGAGKSELLDRLAQLMPEESVEFLSRLTPQALYYAGADHLRHKVVLVDEQAGASEADYSIRTLQSRGVLRLAVPVRGKTESFEARGPIALLSGTTRDDLNPENLSRCLELSLDDSAEQTKRIQEAQRRAWAGERRKALDPVPWQDAQRLLEPCEVVIPFASKLAYPARTTSDRRDNMKLLSLVAAHALLYQQQRERDREGRVVAVLYDYKSVFELLRPLVDQELDGLSPRAGTLYRALVKQGAATFTTREAAALQGWGYNTAKRALAELRAHELLRLAESETPRRYALLDGSLLGNSAALTDPSELR
ncbi:hypothetical protein HY251_20350 [bacterium]|nr:hypothetical protein [bacterium]